MTRCRCGHIQEAHDHYRKGTDCSLCQCDQFKKGPDLAAENAALAKQITEARRALKFMDIAGVARALEP